MTDTAYTWANLDQLNLNHYAKIASRANPHSAMTEAVYKISSHINDWICEDSLAYDDRCQYWPAVYQLGDIAQLFQRENPGAGDALIEWLGDNRSWLIQSAATVEILTDLEAAIQAHRELFPFDQDRCYCDVDSECRYCRNRAALSEIPY